MTSWIILRTDHAKEAYVARQVALMTFKAWNPCQLVATRTAAGRRATAAPAMKIKELPILPRRIFAQVPNWAIWQDELHGIRHLAGIERDAEQRVISIPDGQITAFRAAIEAENTASLALMTRPSKRQRAKWKSLHDALLEMIDGAKQQMELAA